MKAFVTGADGLLGANLVRELLSRGHGVRAMIQPGSKSVTLDGLDIEKVECDLLADYKEIAQAIAGCGVVFHCAAVTDQWADPKLHWNVNLEGTRKILDACLEAGVKKLIFTGSASTMKFGSIQNPGDELAPFAEEYVGVAYVESKSAATKLVREYVEKRGLDAVIVCPTFLIGDYDSRPSSGELIRQFTVRRLQFASSGGKSFVYARDAAVAMANAVERGKAGESYILGGTNISYFDFFSKVAAKVGIAAPKIVLPDKLILAIGALGSAFEKITKRRVKINSSIARLGLCGTYYSNAKARRELGLPQSSIDEALDAAIRSLKKYGHLRGEHTPSFKGKVALITGSSRGVGFAMATQLVKAGANVVISARTERRLMNSKAKLEALGGGKVVAVAGDVGKWEDAKRMVDAAIENFGTLDILVNNAGISMRGYFKDLSPSVCGELVDTDLKGCIYPSRAAVEHIIASGGSIVFISSIAGLFGLPIASIYSATKKALTGLAESLRIELAPLGVHVGVVYLGFTEHDPEKRVISADGSLMSPDRPTHHTQSEAASQILDMIQKRKKQIVMTPVGKLAYIAYRISPGLVEKAIIKALTSQWKVFKNFS